MPRESRVRPANKSMHWGRAAPVFLRRKPYPTPPRGIEEATPHHKGTTFYPLAGTNQYAPPYSPPPVPTPRNLHTPENPKPRCQRRAPWIYSPAAAGATGFISTPSRSLFSTIRMAASPHKIRQEPALALPLLGLYGISPGPPKRKPHRPWRQLYGTMPCPRGQTPAPYCSHVPRIFLPTTPLHARRAGYRTPAPPTVVLTRHRLW